jgi:hypothetical protein
MSSYFKQHLYTYEWKVSLLSFKSSLPARCHIAFRAKADQIIMIIKQFHEIGNIM